MARWAMVIDLRKCIGCETYAILRVDNSTECLLMRDGEECFQLKAPGHMKREFSSHELYALQEPPCLPACPTKATYARWDGIVEINRDLCVGCGYCVLACPYEARVISWEDQLPREVEEGLEQGWPFADDHIGVCTKCNFCSEKIDSGIAKGLRPGLDPEATPNWAELLHCRSLVFGDTDDAESAVSKVILITQYLVFRKISKQIPQSITSPMIEHSQEDALVRKIVVTQRTRQSVWGWPAVLDLTLGRLGAGFYLLSYFLAILNGGMPVGTGIVAAAFIALGFLSLTLEAGRPFRRISIEPCGSIMDVTGDSGWSCLFHRSYPPSFLSSPGFGVLMAVSAIGLIVSHGFILYEALAVTAWQRTILVPMLVITSAFVLGEGLMMLFVAFGIAGMNTGFLIMCLIFLLLDLMLWFAYLNLIRNDKDHAPQANFRRFGPLTISVGLGHILPIMTVIGLFLFPDWKSASGLMYLLLLLV